MRIPKIPTWLIFPIMLIGFLFGRYILSDIVTEEQVYNIMLPIAYIMCAISIALMIIGIIVRHKLDRQTDNKTIGV